MPLSPLLSNVVLRDFDMSLHNAGICVVRYADDFVVFADSHDECVAALSRVKVLLAHRGHTIPELGVGTESKTAIFSPSDAVEFLGLEIRAKDKGYEIVVPQAAFDEVKSRLSLFDTFETARVKSKSLTMAVSTIKSTTEGFLNVYKEAANFANLKSHTENCRQSAVNNLLSSIFGPTALKHLDQDRRLFVGIPGDDDSDYFE